MATKLHQILAVDKGARKAEHTRLTAIYQQLQKLAPLSGISRTYKPNDDENGDTFPSESTQVQVQASRLLQEARDVMEHLWDVTFTKETGNTIATADVVVDGEVLLANAPATYLLWLEKQVVLLNDLVAKIPTLDQGEVWAWNTAQGCYSTQPAQTNKTKKVPRHYETAPATDHHPAQVEFYWEDEVIGHWSTIKYSGALPVTTVREMSDRVTKLQDAVRVALAEANSTEIESMTVNGSLLTYIFEG